MACRTQNGKVNFLGLPERNGGVLLVLDNANPTSFSSKSRTKPYIVSRREAYFDGEMWSDAVWILIFSSEIFAKFSQKSAGVLVRDSPFRCILRVLRGMMNAKGKRCEEGDLRDNQR
jgi:hypothetical protein